jgi:alkylhydroperoxidase family enzyme
VLADWRTAPIHEKLRAMLGLLEKVTLAPTTVTATDMEPLLQLGITEQAIEDALLVCAGFNIIARLADAFDVHVPTPQQFAMAGAMLLKFGYGQ